MDINEEHCEPDNDSSNNISFLLELKNHLQNERLYLEYLHESYDNLSILQYANENNENNENMKFIQDYMDKMRTIYKTIINIDNSQYIDEVNNKLHESCEHEYESDDIETGVECNMMKITYCIHCKMNKP